ncbi:Ufm1-specific protease [Phytophthora cinnamomi]|uniref:Ufm1-specific protease n=1 Tax=Phytophthora cinnamomi TaxID=4785 RepID=UPI00355A5D06|nr:Ufm1-specific protease [Phytophthora cinnamomi]
MEGLLPALLLRSLRRLAAPEDLEDAALYSALTSGALLGTRKSSEGDTQQLAVWGLLRLSPDDAANGQSFDRHLPGGISRVGSFVVVRGERAEPANELESVALQATEQKDEEVVLVYTLATQTAKLFHCKDGKATVITLTVVQCLHARDFHRAIGFAPLRCAVDLHVLGDKSSLLHQLEKYKAATREDEDFYVRVGVMQGKKGRSFRVLNARGEDALSSGNSSVLLESILPEVDDNIDESKSKKKSAKKQKKAGNKKAAAEGDDKLGFLPSLEYGDIANVDLLVSLAPLDAAAEVVAPVVTIPAPSASKSPRQRFHAHCDALVVVPVDASVRETFALLRQQLHEQLTEVANRLKNAPESVTAVTAHQFPLVGAAFPLMVVSNSTGTDDADETMDDVKTLESLHRAFLQPVDQPLFRVSRGCSLSQQGEWLASSDVLYNVHEGIPNSGVDGSQCLSALVDGFYGYYHYMQQGKNDKGWGCAYRSLQTLASWLFVQHFTKQRYLSHDEIQNALVKMGDKPERFRGSTEWIGSLEVGYVLDELFGVTFRSLSVSSGAQLPDVARELIYHFETQGTPVMMGGGQLAFTLLGVDYDPDSGVCAFLTLDPHYTGDEDLTTIQQQTVALEGYKAVPCSWRKTTTFVKNSFYNLCLPQRPSVGV